jgi:hypothetical protein
VCFFLVSTVVIGPLWRRYIIKHLAFV